ncbi:CcdC family protein [Anaerobacillus sp. MEB173]|uniref:CcdC family protein n=1 Tax=Anaerobacillus sp. MEB173 TaxID=3383345 RepID=UPI003F9340FE
MAIISSILAICMAIFAIIIRIRATKRPASVKKIILPPLFMSTGFFMFVYEPARISYLQALEALAVGIIFSILLIKTSKFEIKHNEIYLKQSKMFIFVLFGLLVLRIIIKLIIGVNIEIFELAGMFFVLAYGMIIPWRVAMLMSYKKLEKQVKKVTPKRILPIQQ